MTPLNRTRRYPSEGRRAVHPDLVDFVVEHDISILHYWCRYHERHMLHCDAGCEHRTYCPLYNPHVAKMPP